MKRLIAGLLMAALLLPLRAHADDAAPAACPPPTGPLVTTTPVPGTPKFADRYAAIRQRLTTTRFDVIVLGDSLIHAWPQALLDTIAPGPVLNAGFGADKTENVLWRLQDLDWSKQSPRAVLLLIGTGNIGHPLCNIMAGLSAVIARIHATLPQARVLVISLLPRGVDMGAFADKITDINLRLGAMQQMAGFTLIDVHDRFLCDHRTPCALFNPDNLHLAKPGYALLTSLVRPVVDH
ncbi:MAG: GDSL-type esterase/lipase family protein [Acetobacteraceae bacterium]